MSEVIVRLKDRHIKVKGGEYVQDIVRCRECKYWRNKDPQQIPTASIMCGHMHPDDFCSYGERSSE